MKAATIPGAARLAAGRRDLLEFCHFKRSRPCRGGYAVGGSWAARRNLGHLVLLGHLGPDNDAPEAR
jgi:hypothetical protein